MDTTGTRLPSVSRTMVVRSAAELAEVVERLFDPLRHLRGLLLGIWREASRPEIRLSCADLMATQGSIFESLDAIAEYDSAGYVMAVGILEDRDRYLEWWHRIEHGAYQPLILNLDPDSPGNYDYEIMEWFMAARDEGRRFVSGPLIDLACAEAHVMTFSEPVYADDVFLGIAGADVKMSLLESLVLPPLLRIPAATVLVNASRRVIAANTPRWTAGDKLARLPVASEWEVVAPVVPDLGWVLAVSTD